MEYTNGSNKITVLVKEGNYALLKRDTEFDPFIVAYAFQKNDQDKTCEWGQGYYFANFENALNLLYKKVSCSNEMEGEYKFEVGELVIADDAIKNKRLVEIIGKTNYETPTGKANKYAVRRIDNNYPFLEFEENLYKANEKNLSNENLFNEKSVPKAKIVSRPKADNSNTFRR